MYYDERIIDGQIHYRTTPSGQWKPLRGIKADAYRAMATLTCDERMDVMRFFCRECGVTLGGGSCVCCRDE